MSVNKVILVGRLGKDPETRYMTNGEAVTNVTLATSENWKDKSGEKQEKTEWHNLVFYRRLAEDRGRIPEEGFADLRRRQASRHASGRTRKPAKTATPPRSSSTRCRCWAARPAAQAALKWWRTNHSSRAQCSGSQACRRTRSQEQLR